LFALQALYEGLKKLSIPPDPKVIDYVRRKLGIDNVV
jgi:hypothetical protein